MVKHAAFARLLLAVLGGGTAQAQTFPSPTFNGITLQSDPATASGAVRRGYLDQRLGGALPNLSACTLLGGTGAAGAAQGVALGAGLNCAGNTLAPAFGTAAGTVAAGNDARINGALQAAGGDAWGTSVRAAGASTTRGLASVLADRIKVLDFGARCDGTTDDTAAVQAAFAAAAAVPGGAMLEVPQRSCLISSTIVQSLGAGRSIHLWGAGGTSGFVSANGSGVAITLADTTATFSASHIAFVRSGSGQAGTALSVTANALQLLTIGHFRGLVITGNTSTGGTAAWQTGIRLTGLSAPVIDGVRVLMPDGTGNGTGGTGLVLAGADLAHFLTDAKISNSLFQGGRAGLAIEGAVQGAFVSNSEMVGNDYGIYASDPGGANLQEALIVTNTHLNNALAGIYMGYINQNQISNNLFLHFNPVDGRGWQAIMADHSGWNVIQGNGLVGAGKGGETFYKATGQSQLHTVTGNNVVYLAGYCIDTQDAFNVVASGNSCQAVTAPGIVLGATSFSTGNIMNGANQLVGAGSGTAVVGGDLSIAGTATAPTAAADTATGQLATTAFVLNQAAQAAPQAPGTAAAGSSTRFARADHVHPTDTTRAPLASPSFTGTVTIPAGASIAGFAPLASPALTGVPTVPTAAAGDSSTTVATTAFVGTAVGSRAPLASPALTGTPTGPTAASGTGTTQLATTAFVQAALPSFASPAFTGTPTAPTASAGTSSTQLATTAFVQTAIPASTAPAFQMMNASGTFVPAAGSTWVRFRLFGPGGGGGAGITCAASSSCSGGGGGGGGGMTEFLVPAAMVQSGGCSITIGAVGTSNTVVTCNTGFSKTAYRGGNGAAGQAGANAGAGGGGSDVGAGGNGSGANDGGNSTYPTTGTGTTIGLSSGASGRSNGSCARGTDSTVFPTGGASGTGLNAGVAQGNASNCFGGINPMNTDFHTPTDTGCEPNVGGAAGLASTSAASGVGKPGGMPGGGGGGGGSGTVGGGAAGAGGAGRVCVWQG